MCVMPPATRSLFLLLCLCHTSQQTCEQPQRTSRNGNPDSKTIAQPCDSEVSFDTPAMCRKWSNVAMDHVALYWKPFDQLTEYRMEVNDGKVILTNDSGSEMGSDFLPSVIAQTGKDTDTYFPFITHFTGVHEGDYRCAAELPCDDITQDSIVSNFSITIRLSEHTSRPKAHIACEGCVPDDICKKAYDSSDCSRTSFFLTYSGSWSNFTCKVYYPGCPPYPTAVWEQKIGAQWTAVDFSSFQNLENVVDDKTRLSFLQFQHIEREQRNRL